MKVYQISYDLRQQKNYEALYERIKKLGNWCHALESCWVVTTDKTAGQIRDSLKPALDQDDGLLATKLTGEAAWCGLGDRVSQWLKQQLEAATV